MIMKKKIIPVMKKFMIPPISSCCRIINMATRKLILLSM